MNIITLNQLVTWFQSFQERHYFLKDFGFGEPYDIGTSRQMNFPYMWLTLNEDSVIPVASNNKTAIPELSFSVFFMDKINDQENYLDQNGYQSDNSQEILSDCIQYLQDLITEIQSHWQPYGVLFSQDVSFFPIVDETQDKATGINGRIVLRLKQVNCIIPVSPINPVTTTTTTTPSCNITIGLVGEFNGYNPNDPAYLSNPSNDCENWVLTGWTIASSSLTQFVQDNDYSTSWGGTSFPSGTGTYGGGDIPVPSGTWDVTFNSNTGVYEFVAGQAPTPTPTNTPTETPTPTNTPTETPTSTPTSTPTPTSTSTPTPTSTCSITTQYLEVNLGGCSNFSLKLYNDSGFTSNANALCDYTISGTAYGDQGTIYNGAEIIQTNDHTHTFNLNPILQPGECVSGFTVNSYSTSGCTCPVTLILP